MRLCAVPHKTEAHYDGVGPSTIFFNLKKHSVDPKSTGLLHSVCFCVFVAVCVRVVTPLFPPYPSLLSSLFMLYTSYIHTYMHAYIYTYILLVHTYLHIHTFTFAHTQCIKMHTNMYIHTYIRTCTYTHIHTHIRIHTCTRTYIHVHT